MLALKQTILRILFFYIHCTHFHSWMGGTGPYDDGKSPGTCKSCTPCAHRTPYPTLKSTGKFRDIARSLQINVSLLRPCFLPSAYTNVCPSVANSPGSGLCWSPQLKSNNEVHSCKNINSCVGISTARGGRNEYELLSSFASSNWQGEYCWNHSCIVFIRLGPHKPRSCPNAEICSLHF